MKLKTACLAAGILFTSINGYNENMYDASIGATVELNDGSGNYFLKTEEGWQEYTEDGFRYKQIHMQPEVTKTSEIERLLNEGAKYYEKGYGEKEREAVKEFQDNLPYLPIDRYVNSRIIIDGKIIGEAEYQKILQAFDYAWTDKEQAMSILEDNRVDATEIFGVFASDSTMFVFSTRENAALSYLAAEINKLYQKTYNTDNELKLNKEDFWCLFGVQDFFTGLADVINEQIEHNKTIYTYGREFYIMGEIGEKFRSRKVYNDNTKEERNIDAEEVSLFSKVTDYLRKADSSVKMLVNDLYYRGNLLVEIDGGNLQLAFIGSDYYLTVRYQENMEPRGRRKPRQPQKVTYQN